MNTLEYNVGECVVLKPNEIMTTYDRQIETFVNKRNICLVIETKYIIKSNTVLVKILVNDSVFWTYDVLGYNRFAKVL